MPKIFGSTSPFRWSTISNCWLSHPMQACCLKASYFSQQNCWFNRSTSLIFPVFFWGGGARNRSTSSPVFPQEGELQKLVFDDPSTSQVEDYWLHPCDCLNPTTWGTGAGSDGPVVGGFMPFFPHHPPL
jgi:hypothetical protein